MERKIIGEMIHLRQLALADFSDVKRIYWECPTFFQTLSGLSRVSDDYIRDEMTGVPKNFDPANKYFFGVFLNETPHRGIVF